LKPEQYKVHLASYNGNVQPLDEFVSDRKAWDGWNSWRSKKNDFNRPYIFALMDFYPEPDHWLFGGVYKVLERYKVKRQQGYRIERVQDYEAWVGRLKITFKRPSRTKSLRFESCYQHMVASEILAEPYGGECFPGYEDISHDFTALEPIFRKERLDWKTPLENVKGVYLVSDKRNGKKYVGAAYGETGIWSRWKCYLENGHGGNDELVKLIKRKGLNYARQNFVITLLEYRAAKTDDQIIIERETFWKHALMSRTPHGYNKN